VIGAGGAKDRSRERAASTSHSHFLTWSSMIETDLCCTYNAFSLAGLSRSLAGTAFRLCSILGFVYKAV
jgi:hypothetical protein